VTFVESIRTGFYKYATFSGRATRAEYWMFTLFVTLGSAGMLIIDTAISGPSVTNITNAFGDPSGAFEVTPSFNAWYGNGPLSSFWGLLTFLPLLSAGWRRLQDTGRPGWYLLLPGIIMITIVLGMLAAMGVFSGGWSTLEGGLLRLEDFGVRRIFLGIVAAFIPFIVLTVFLSQRSQPGPNHFGPNPHEVSP
jgi:uncharacterized membrane protein YhaH (DUF805 family)